MKHRDIRSVRAIVLYVFVPFMVAYLLSELYRNVNGIVAPILRAELGLGAEYLGLMTSLFLAAVAGAQVFTGIWLDRYGPRRTVSCLLFIGATGALLFATGHPAGLLIGRFLIGLGMAGCWTAAFKVNRQWWPADRLTLANGAIIGFAGVGALLSTLPTQLLLARISWSAMFVALAIITVAVSVFLLCWAPDHPDDHHDNHSIDTLGDQIRGFAVVVRNPVFVRVVPISALCQGMWLAYQGLWAGVWLREVNRLDDLTAATHLLFFAIAIVAGNLLLSLVADRLARRGIPIVRSMALLCALCITAQCVILAHPGAFTAHVWVLVGFTFSGALFAYALVSSAVPVNLSGRAVSLLNLLATLSGFVIQYGVGALIEFWHPAADGTYPLAAHRSAFGAVIFCQIVAFLWLIAAPGTRVQARKDAEAAEKS